MSIDDDTLAHRERERKQFTNPARDDGLVLRHWQRKEDTGIAALATPADSNIASEMDTEEKEKDGKAESGYRFAKFNVKVTVPEYTDQQYESHLKSEDWSKEETDYLVNLAQEYDLRWIVISDRYEYQPSDPPKENADSMALTVPSKERSMEDMKARYYSVAAKTMALKQPLQSMSTTEFELHEKMTKFDASLETTRKKLAQTLFVRPLEEVKEEEILLAELKRIVTNQERFSQERKELYDRLQAPHSAAGSTAMYKTSQDLLKLMQDLLSADKNKKRRSMGGPGEGGPGMANGPSAGASDRGPRSSLGGSGAGNDKRSSLSGSTSAGLKQLSTREEAKFGIAHLERTSTGTTFRHERINNLAKAKSNALTLKMTHALQELGIPMRLSMPTAAVCNEYEKLVGSIHTLLDVRKVSEKLEAEIKIARAQVEEKVVGAGNGEQGRLELVTVGEDGDEDAEGEDDDEADVVPERAQKEENDDEEDEDGDGDEEEEEEEEDDDDEAQGKETAVADSADEDADGDEGPEEKTPSEAATMRRNSVRKRSASVVSHFSNKSSRSTKRQRK